MSGWLADRIGIHIDFNQIVHDMFASLGQGLAQLGRNIADIAPVVANFLVQADPTHLIIEGLETNPITGHMFMELNNVLGGAFTTVDNLSTLPLRVVRGDGITKQELVTDGLFVLKVVAVVVSGGSAAAIIAATSGQLAQGTLGKTALGKAILLIGAAVGGAALMQVPVPVDDFSAAGEMASEDAATSAAGTVVQTAAPSVGQVAVTATENVALSTAQTQVIQHSPLGQTVLGQIAIGAGFAAGGAGVQGGDVGSAVTGSIQSGAQGQAISQAAKMVPGGGAAANFLINNAGGLVSTSDPSADPSSFDLTQIPGKIADAFSNISISMPSIGGGGGLDLSSINLPSFGLPGIAAPSVSAPSISAPEINIGQIPKIQTPAGLKQVASRQKRIVNGRSVTHYVLTDGSQLDVPDATSPQVLTASVSPYMIIGGAFILFSLMKGHRE